jgi:hypothetical protein
MASAQEWCLECGAGMPGALVRRPAWRSTAAIISGAVVLAAGAVAAGYAALNNDSNNAVLPPTTVTQTVPADTGAGVASASTPPAATAATPSVSTPAAPAKATPVPVAKSAPPILTTAATATPPPVATSAPPILTTGATQTATPTPTHTSTSTSTSNSTPPPAPISKPGTKILIDPNAASSYNPYGIKTSFGDPALAIDGDKGTAWYAGVDPSSSSLAVGLDIDLRSEQTVAKVDVSTSTPGMSFEVYGTTEATDPPSITDPGWVHIGSAHPATRHTKIALHAGGRRFRHILLWVTRAAPAPAGGGSAPTFVAINEVDIIS